MERLLKYFEPEGIPKELKEKALWCQWKFIYSGKDGEPLKKPSKVLVNPRTGYYGKSNNPETFASYSIATKKLYKDTCGMGLGVFNGYSAVDIDDCVDDNGNFSEMALDIMKAIPSYTELSPSNHGVRIIFKTDYIIDKDTHYIHNSKLGLEIYISGNTYKFLTITGHALNNLPINKIDITPVMEKYMKKKKPIKTHEYQEYNNQTRLSSITPGEFRKFLNKDPVLNKAWYDHAPGHRADENQKDSRLCTKLCFYLGKDPDKINNMFMKSPYYASKDQEHKYKWSVRKDYRETTIKKAMALVNEVYSPDFKKRKKSLEKESESGLEVSCFFDDNGTYQGVSDKADASITLIFKKNTEPIKKRCDIILTKARLTTYKNQIAIYVEKYNTK